MMKPAQIKELRARLQDWQAELKAALEQSEASGSTVQLDQTRQGRLSRMDAMQGQAMAQAATARAKNQLKRIEAALGRLNEEGFGDCLDCGEQIPFARLQFDPTAQRCVDCAQAQEGADS